MIRVPPNPALGEHIVPPRQRAYGLADRGFGHREPVGRGSPLSLTSAVRSVLRDDLPLIGGDVTVEHLLNHTSGIGDYVDEETGQLSPDLPVHRLVDTEDYLLATRIAREVPAAPGSAIATADTCCWH